MNCQKCRTPLKLDSSLQDLSPATFDLLVGSGHNLDSATVTTTRPAYPSDRKDFYDRTAQNAGPPVFKRVIPPPYQIPIAPLNTPPPLKNNQRDSNPAMSFVMLTESQIAPPESASSKTSPSKRRLTTPNPIPSSKQTLSHQLDSADRLFAILSAHSDIDHPICTECTDLLLSSLQSRLQAAQKDRDSTLSFLKQLNSSLPTTSQLSAAQSALDTTLAKESKAMSTLLSLEREKATLESSLADLESQSRSLVLEEQAFWRSRNSFSLQLSEFQNKRDALNAAYDHDARHLERLQRTNVYNDTFCIGHDGFFGTINGLRLGRLPPLQNVEWGEINAAWGCACLLLATVAEKLGFVFRGYKLRPMGSTSRIDKIEYPPQTQKSKSSTATLSSTATTTTTTTTTTSTPSPTPPPSHPKTTSLDLFSSGDLPLGRMILHRRLDAGMVAFLDCLRQLGDFVEHGHSPASRESATPSPDANSTSIKLPYAIHKDRIGETSIRLSASQDDAWTRACKYVLTCCKFLLAHTSNVGEKPGGSGA